MLRTCQVARRASSPTRMGMAAKEPTSMTMPNSRRRVQPKTAATSATAKLEDHCAATDGIAGPYPTATASRLPGCVGATDRPMFGQGRPARERHPRTTHSGSRPVPEVRRLSSAGAADRICRQMDTVPRAVRDDAGPEDGPRTRRRRSRPHGHGGRAQAPTMATRDPANLPSVCPRGRDRDRRKQAKMMQDGVRQSRVTASAQE